MSAPSDPQYLAVPQVMKALGIGRHTVLKMLDDGLPHQMVGKKIIILRADLDLFLASRATVKRGA